MLNNIDLPIFLIFYPIILRINWKLNGAMNVFNIE